LKPLLEGYRERLAFLYDSRKVHFGGLASQIFIPPIKKEGGKTLEPTKQLARTPFATRFQIDWFKFRICTTHLLYGENYVARS
jgi:hypothetical protein